MSAIIEDLEQQLDELKERDVTGHEYMLEQAARIIERVCQCIDDGEPSE